MDLRLELVTVPVSDIDRAIAFYTEQIGFSVEQDVQIDDGHRFVELMPLAHSARSLCRRVMWTRYPGRLPVCSSMLTTSTRCTRSYGDSASPCRTCGTIRGGDSVSSPTPTVTTGRSTAHCLPSSGPPHNAQVRRRYRVDWHPHASGLPGQPSGRHARLRPQTERAAIPVVDP